jgi:uncharacterized protein (DUF2235 family)
MAKNIVLLSDGTGNSAAKLFKTNVWRIHGALDLSDPSRQVAYYDNGVGTSSFRPLAVLGGVFGFGLKRNVLDLYCYACRNYRVGDRIFCFGFSRGAFTIRVVAGMIARVGLVACDRGEAQLARDALSAYRVYRSRFNVSVGLVVKPLRLLRDAISSLWRRARGLQPGRRIEVKTIHFMGVWDTVAAYGGPIEEVTRGIDYWIWPLSMPDRYMSAKIKRACHALALDDERNAFWPVLWDESFVSGKNGTQQPMTEDWTPPDKPNLPEIDRQRVSQVWFAGMHSDVGGGYAQDGLSYVTLDWMMDRALAYDLILKPAEGDRLRELADPFDELNDSRHGLGGYYRYKPRKLSDVYDIDPIKATITGDVGRMVRTAMGAAGRTPHAEGEEPAAAASQPSPIIHESVFRRLASGLDAYSPIVLPETYRVTTKAGAIQDELYEHPSQAAARTRRQERAWNWVWLRRVVYFATVFASLFVAALPLIVKRWPGPGKESRAAFLLPLVDAAGAFLPGLASPWIGAFREAPGPFAVGAAIVAGLLLWGGALQRRIGDVMLDIWHPAVDGPPHRVGPWPAPTDRLFRVRSSKLYRGFFYWLTHWILPTAFAAAMIYAVPVGLSRVLFAVGDSLGLVCSDADPKSLFDTASLCHNTGVKVQADRTYTVTLTPTEEWRDGYGGSSPPGIKTGPKGFGWHETTWTMVPGLPLRRHLTENWFAVVARIGATGGDEQVLRFTELEPIAPEKRKKYQATFKAGSSGEVFMFVNDAVIGVPWLAGLFYGNNKGQAEVAIEAEAGQRGAGGPSRP